MFRKTLSVLAAVSQLCLLVALGGRTASAAAVALNPNQQQLILSPTNVIGGSGAYNSTNNSAYNDNSQGFAAGNIFSTQTGTVTENPYGGFWISGDNSPPTAYITIDLGASYDNLSQIELFNTHNGPYNDRGTGDFKILGSNSVTFDPITGGYNLSGTITQLISDTLQAAGPSDPIAGQTFDVGANGFFRYLEFEADTVASSGTEHDSVSFGLNELRVFTTPEPGSVVALVGVCGIGLIGLVLRRRAKSLISSRTFLQSSIVLTVVSSVCLLGALGNQTASAAAVTLIPGSLQLTLSPSNVIGGSGSYGGPGLNTTFNDTSVGPGFEANNIFSSQTGTITEDPYTGFWISSDTGPTPSYITIDLGARYDLSQIELFNTHNGPYNDRGTGDFKILGSNSVTFDSITGGYNLSGTITQLISDVLSPAAGSPSDGSGTIAGQTFDVGNTGSFRYLEFEADTMSAGNGNMSGSAFGLNEMRVFTTPEPGSVVALIGLVGMGLIGLGLRRRQQSYLAKRS